MNWFLLYILGGLLVSALIIILTLYDYYKKLDGELLRKAALSLLGVLLGALITLATADYYYRRGGEELLRETERLRKLNTMMLVGLEKMGAVKLTWKNGEIVEYIPVYGSINAILPPVESSVKVNVGLPSENKGKQGKPR